jgi:PAS domain S-box-containing protein
LVKRASELAEGNRDFDFHIDTGDEIEELGERFRDAAESLEQQRQQLIEARDELASLNATLEEKVRDRTRELVASREKYRLLVDASPDPLCLIQKGRFQFVNRAFVETFGYTEEQVAADDFSIEKVVHPDFTRVALEVLNRAEQNDEPVDTDWVGIGRGGRSLDLSVRGRRVTYQESPAVELLLIDLTDKKRLMRQVVHHERMRGIGEMTAMVAHNFNNLLAVILGRTQLIQERSKDPMVCKGLEIIRTSALQGGEIVRRIQDYTSDTADMHFQEIHLGSVVRDVASYLENYWRMTRGTGSGPVQMELDLAAVPPVLGSEALLTDLMKHILFNAAESMPNGGTIRASVGMRGDSVAVRIEDSGVGLSTEARRRAFDPFFTTKGSRHRGLGLSASYGIIQRHRGRIEMLDREEGGTAVEISLPVHRAVIRESSAGDPSVLVLSEEQQTARQLRRMMGDSAAAKPETDHRTEAA